jgi:hypothetical protein
VSDITNYLKSVATTAVHKPIGNTENVGVKVVSSEGSEVRVLSNTNIANNSIQFSDVEQLDVSDVAEIESQALTKEPVFIDWTKARLDTNNTNNMLTPSINVTSDSVQFFGIFQKVMLATADVPNVPLDKIRVFIDWEQGDSTWTNGKFGKSFMLEGKFKDGTSFEVLTPQRKWHLEGNFFYAGYSTEYFGGPSDIPMEGRILEQIKVVAAPCWQCDFSVRIEIVPENNKQ